MTPGRLLLAVGLAGLGVLSLGSGDFAYSWQPVPPGIPLREVLARISGLILFLGGIGLLPKRTAVPAALVVTVYLSSWVLLLQGPRVAQAPGDVGAWLGFCENLIMMSGGWILFVSLARAENPRAGFMTGDRALRVAGFLVGLSCLVLGLSHFVYADATAGMVPAWLPGRLGFAYLTGTAHFAAGVGILLRILPGLAAALEAVMISLFVILVHLPGVVAQPAGRLPWTMLFVAIMLAGAFWTTAKSLRRA